MTDQTLDRDDDAARRRLRRVAVRVIVVQIITLFALLMLQARFSTF